MSFSITKREKEIGIRKVLGAKVSSVTSMFFKEVLFLFVIAEKIAIPVNYYLSNQWLRSFQYRSVLGFGQIGIIMLAIIIVSLVTILQIVKVAYMNPADVIKED